MHIYYSVVFVRQALGLAGYSTSVLLIGCNPDAGQGCSHLKA